MNWGLPTPQNRKKYEANARNLKVRIEGLHKELERMLEPVKDAPYIVFHDAYQYMEKRYGLTPIGSVTLSPEKKPGTARLVEIRKKIRGLKSICVFTEPQFQPRLVQIIMGGTGAARTGVLDSLGSGRSRRGGCLFHPHARDGEISQDVSFREII